MLHTALARRTVVGSSVAGASFVEEIASNRRGAERLREELF